ncbi:MAG: proton-conducting transporter membrane subunit [Thermoproteus sp.]
MIQWLLPLYVAARRAGERGVWAYAVDAAAFAYAAYSLASAGEGALALLLLPYLVAPVLVPRGRLRDYSGLAAALSAYGVLLMASPEPHYKALGFAMAVAAPGALIAASPDLGSVEALFRYFVVSTVAGSLVVAGLSAGGELGSALAFSGVALELGVFPAFYWVPDVFGRSAPEGLVLISGLAKLGAAFALMLLPLDVPAYASLPLAAASILVGNLGATASRDPRRLLGFASVFHAGLALFAFAVYKPLAPFLMFADSIGAMGLFSHISSPGPRWSAYVLSLNQIGIPPLLGFWPKLALLVLTAQRLGPAAAAYLLANVVWSVAYYIRLASSTSAGAGRRPLAASLASAALGAAAPLWLLAAMPLLLPH